MSYSTFSSRLFQLTTLSIALALAGCGGDGFKDLGPKPELGSVENEGGTTVGGTGGTGTGTVVGQSIFIEGKLLNAQGSPVRNINVDGAEYKVKVLDKNKQPIVGAIVNFSINSTGVSLSQSTSGAYLTDDNGEASVFVKPDNIEVSGAYIVSATATINGNSQNVEQTFSVQAEDAALGDITLEKSSLLSGEETAVKLNVLNKQGNKASGIAVDLSASCGSIPAQITSDYQGVVSAVYKSVDENGKACSGNVTIFARKGSQTKEAKVSIAQPTPTTILYTSQDLQVLGLGDSGTTSTSQVEFTVYNNKQPLPNQKVVLSLTQTPEGFSFGQKDNTDDLSLISDAEGKVRVNLYPGSTPGPIEIKATIDNNGNGQVDQDDIIFALSKNLSVGGGRVTQSGISVGFEKNVLDWSVNGNSTTVTARLKDRNGNPVPAGTVVSFTAEGGKIDPSCQTDKDGNCSVNFATHKGPHNDHRISILAVVEGEKDFIDKNQNNSWDKDEPFVYNIGDTFRDDNENGIRDAGELIYPLRANGNQKCEDNMRDKYSNKNTRDIYKFNWVMPNIDKTCTDKLTAPVRSQVITLLSDSRRPFIIIGKNAKNPNAKPVLKYDTSEPKDPKDPNGPRKQIEVNVANPYAIGVDFTVPQEINAGDGDIYFLVNSRPYPLNPLPSGTTFESEVVDKTTKNDKECSVEVSYDTGVPNNVFGNKEDNLGTVTRLSLTDCDVGDEVKFRVTSEGHESKYSYKIQK